MTLFLPMKGSESFAERVRWETIGPVFVSAPQEKDGAEIKSRS